jgi:hypothetical protein
MTWRSARTTCSTSGSSGIDANLICVTVRSQVRSCGWSEWCFIFAELCVFASSRKTVSKAALAHARTQTRKEKPENVYPVVFGFRSIDEPQMAGALPPVGRIGPINGSMGCGDEFRRSAGSKNRHTGSARAVNGLNPASAKCVLS